MRGNSPVRFGKRPTEKDPNHGHLAGGLFHSTGGSWKRSTLTNGHRGGTPDRETGGTQAPGPTSQPLPPRQLPTQPTSILAIALCAGAVAIVAAGALSARSLRTTELTHAQESPHVQKRAAR
jgi:hypothetical protein